MDLSVIETELLVFELLPALHDRVESSAPVMVQLLAEDPPELGRTLLEKATCLGIGRDDLAARIHGNDAVRGGIDDLVELGCKGLKDDSSDEDIKNRLITLSNRAEGFLKLGYFYSSLKDCEEILEKNKNHLKLLDKTQLDKIINRKARSKEQLANNLEDINKIDEIYDKISEENKKIFNIENIKKTLNEKKNNMKGIFNKKEMLDYEKNCFEIINAKKYYLDSINKEFKYTNYFNRDLIQDSFDTKKGNHYIAKDNIKEGTLLIVEIPLISIYEAEIKKFSSTFEKFQKMGFSSSE